uniref:Uncharacterized protein n=1 Tax=Romanomermis culicivorax TaxID=13658 RepID=A0A915L142_ROMCU
MYGIDKLLIRNVNIERPFFGPRIPVKAFVQIKEAINRHSNVTMLYLNVERYFSNDVNEMESYQATDEHKADASVCNIRCA